MTLWGFKRNGGSYFACINHLAEGGGVGDGFSDGVWGRLGLFGGALSVWGQVLVGGDRHFAFGLTADGGGFLSVAIVRAGGLVRAESG